MTKKRPQNNDRPAPDKATWDAMKDCGCGPFRIGRDGQVCGHCGGAIRATIGTCLPDMTISDRSVVYPTVAAELSDADRAFLQRAMEFAAALELAALAAQAMPRFPAPEPMRKRIGIVRLDIP